MIRRAALLAAAGLTLGLVACSQSQVTETLALVVTAADAAVTTLQATGQIPPGTATLITNYLSEVSTGVSFATMELASTDSSALKASRIAQEFASITVPNLPVGTATAIGATVAAVVSAVSNFLATIQPAAASLTAAGAPTPKQIKVAKSALSKIDSQNAQLKLRLAQLPRK